jgi:hypothetical protein
MRKFDVTGHGIKIYGGAFKAKLCLDPHQFFGFFLFLLAHDLCLSLPFVAGSLN